MLMDCSVVDAYLCSCKIGDELKNIADQLLKNEEAIEKIRIMSSLNAEEVLEYVNQKNMVKDSILQNL